MERGGETLEFSLPEGNQSRDFLTGYSSFIRVSMYFGFLSTLFPFSVLKISKDKSSSKKTSWIILKKHKMITSLYLLQGRNASKDSLAWSTKQVRFNCSPCIGEKWLKMEQIFKKINNKGSKTILLVQRGSSS